MSTPGLISSLLLWVSLAMYTHRQPRAPHAKRWLWASLPILFCLSHSKMIYITGIVPLILAELAAFGWCAFAISRITTLPRTASVYCAIWVHMTTLSAYELWQLLLWVFDDGGRTPSPAQLHFGQIGFTIAFYLIQYFTQVQVLPIDGKATVGPRQLGSALAVWGLFVVQFQCMLSLYGAGTSLTSRRVLVLLLMQLYCPVFLSAQNALFRKSAMDKELAAITALYERQRSQYQTARRNVQLIYKRCHDLKMQLAAVRQCLPADFPAQDWSEAERAVSIVDRFAHTGNEVLDTVLTEKALDCATRSVNINTVADGKALDFLEPADLYALFAGLLDGLIGIVKDVPQADRRQIDVMVFARQGFAVLQLVTAVRPEELPPQQVRENSAEHKVIEKIVRQYNGLLTTEMVENGYSVKIVLPAAQ